MKRFLSLLLAVVLVLTLFPALPMKAEAKTGGKLVALTFDDGPSSKYTTQLLDGLKERGVPVTFFMLGEMAASNRTIVRRAYEEGHEIACHTWDHPNLTNCSTEKVKKQIEDTFEELDRACGDEADYLVRPPYGSTNQKVRDAIDAPLIYWSVDSEDWSLLNVEKVRKKIVADTYDGAIILCHDIHKTTIPAALQEKIQAEFWAAYCDDARAEEIMGRVYKEKGYLCDPHTASGWAAAEDYVAETGDNRPMVVLSTASPYKFPVAVLTAIGGDTSGTEFAQMDRLSAITGVSVPKNLSGLLGKEEKHTGVIEKDTMLDYVLNL